MIAPLSPLLVLPFIFLLLGLSLGPLCFRKWWYQFELPLLIAVIACTLLGLISAWSVPYTFNHVVHILEHEYIPFVVMVYVLFTVSTGLKISLSGKPSTFGNMIFLLFGGLLASIIGTTGASMLLIYPFVKWNRQHHHKTHLILFFILMVSNIGGSLSPLGDPPLFIGFLQGVPFKWPLLNLYPMVLVSFIWLLTLFYMCDKYSLSYNRITFEYISHFLKKLPVLCQKQYPYHEAQHHHFKIHIQGKIQFIFIPLIILTLLLLSEETTPLFMREFILLAICLSSFIVDKKYYGFLSQKGHWSPVLEICRVFLAIFISVSPIAMMLQQGEQGPFASILAIANTQNGPNTTLYFWLTGVFSAFLDNAPTYLIFLKMIGGSTQEIITHHNTTLKAISIGSIFFGAITYIGNAPNFMVRSIAKQHDIAMPSFMAYIFWASLILLPLAWIIAYIWF